MNLLNTSNLRRITDMDDFEETKTLKQNKKHLKGKIRFCNLVGEQAKEESKVIDETLKHISKSAMVEDFEQQSELRSKEKLEKVKRYVLSKDRSDLHYQSQLPKLKDWKQKYIGKNWYQEQRGDNYKSLDKFLTYRDQLQKQEMYEFSSQLRADESTKYDSDLMNRQNNNSNSKIANLDNLIYSISYYDQLYQKNLELPVISEKQMNVEDNEEQKKSKAIEQLINPKQEEKQEEENKKTWYMKNSERVKKQEKQKENKVQTITVVRENHNIELKIKSENNKQIKEYRKMYVIRVEQVNFNSLQVKEIKNFPVYGEIQKRKKLQQDMSYFCNRMTEEFKSNKQLDNVYLLNQVAVYNLAEVHMKCNVLLVSSLVNINLWTELVEFHKLQFFREEHLNFILEYINNSQSCKEIRQFMYNRNKWQIVEIDESEELLEKYNKGLCQLEKNLVQIKKDHKIKEAIDQQEIMLNSHECQTNDLVQLDNVYDSNKNKEKDVYGCSYDFKQIVNQILKHFEDETEIKQDHMRMFWEKIQTEYYLHDNDIQKVQKVKIIDNKLQDMLDKEFDLSKIDQIAPKDNIYIYSWDEGKKEKKKDFIEQNINNTQNPVERIVKTINKMYPLLSEMNIPKMETKYNFTRKDLHHLYIRFKSLVYMNAMDNKEAEVGVGLDFETFRKGLTTQFANAHEDLIKRMFYSENKDYYMRWKAFLTILSSVKVNSLETKLSLFFTLMDSNKNGLMSFDQIQHLCQLSLQKLISMRKQEYQNQEQQSVIEELAYYLASLIYNATGLDQNQEIDISKLKEILTNEGQDVDIMLMMCCAEKQIYQQFEDTLNKDELNDILTQQTNQQDNKIKKLYKQLLKYRKDDGGIVLPLINSHQNKQEKGEIFSQKKNRKHCRKSFAVNIDVLKKKFQSFQPELGNKIQQMVEKRRLNSKDFLNDQAALIEAKILMCFGIVPAFV